MKSDDTKWINNFRRTAYEWLLGNFNEKDMPEWVILPFDNPDLYNDKEFLVHLENISQYKTLTIGNYRNREIGLLSSKFGSPAVAMTIDVLALAGVRGVIGIGFCGGLKSDQDSGSFVIPEGAVRDEGASDAYVSKSYPAIADAGVISSLKKAALAASKKAELGIVWSTDGILRETDTKINYWREKNIIAVDMESSSFLTVARMFGIKAGNILVVSDNPQSGRQADREALIKGHRSAIKVVFEAAYELIQRNLR